MDERDARILVELTRAPFAPLEEVGRRVGTTGTAVKARLDALARRGALSGFACCPDAAPLGRHARLAFFAGEPVAAPLRQLVAEVEEAAWASRSYPPATAVMLYREDADAPLPESLLRAAGRSPDQVVVPAAPRGARDALSPLDWRVLRPLVDAPRAPVAELARAAGLSARVARERRDRLVASGDAYAFPLVDATQEEGAILYNAYVSGDPAALRGLRLANAHPVVTHHDPPGTYLVGFVHTFAEAHVVEARLRAAPGVASVLFNVPQGSVVARERLGLWVDGQLERWRKARRVKA